MRVDDLFGFAVDLAALALALYEALESVTLVEFRLESGEHFELVGREGVGL